MISALLVAALVQSAAINSERDSFVACLENTVRGAKATKMAPETLEPHLRRSCAASEEKFKTALIAFDVKNKVGRKQATADAQLQADDFVISSVDEYKAVLARK